VLILDADVIKELPLETKDTFGHSWVMRQYEKLLVGRQGRGLIDNDGAA
jgi:hypothetical protein